MQNHVQMGELPKLIASVHEAFRSLGYGSQYMSRVFGDEIAFLGAERSPAFVPAPEGNGCAERFISTLKKNLLLVKTFETIEELRQALLAFKDIYNTTWLIGRLGHRTLAAVRRDLLSPTALAA